VARLDAARERDGGREGEREEGEEAVLTTARHDQAYRRLDVWFFRPRDILFIRYWLFVRSVG
jgi:hypothetical protein